MIGNIGEGRPNPEDTMDVSVYRLMPFPLKDELIKNSVPKPQTGYSARRASMPVKSFVKS